ncbi:RNA polymerase subunit sigma-70 [Spongisporangium articulatum]|uniref:RNA polymerase subunit sigma-70 n=1 Tax=Spongisporangium articulatum TaxID=3362603 RepID=A0ABW8AMH1_9ACTN
MSERPAVSANPDPTPDFEAMVARHRRELHVHCYRMLASFDEAEDAVQETFLRAWRSEDRLTVGAARAWLYRIATNVCLDQLRRRSRQATQVEDPHSMAEIPQLQPYPDRLLDELAAPPEQPDEVAVRRETIELAFLAAVQALPAKQRATFLVRDLLGWSAAETADALGTSVAAANSALQRARATMQAKLPARRADWATPPAGEEERELLARFIEASERGDYELAVSISAENIRVTMPPYPMVYDGLAAIDPLLRRMMVEKSDGDWRLVPTSANRMPAAANYLRRPGDTQFRAFKVDLLRTEGDKIVEITTFGPELFARFGLPEILAVT